MASKDEGIMAELDDSAEFDESDLVTLVDEDENEHDFVVLAIVEMDDRQFAMLAPKDQVDDDSEPELELFLFTYAEGEDGIAEFGEIETDELYEAVQAYCATLVDGDEGIQITGLEPGEA